VWIPIKKFVKGLSVSSRSWIMEGLLLYVEGLRVVALFGELTGE
jgi:hypothetical protein